MSSVVADGGDCKWCVFFLDCRDLMRRWSPDSSEMRVINQTVVPADYRAQILSLAHESRLAGHFSVKKTYNRVLRNLYCPGSKTDIVKYCHTCHTCQLVGKPNQLISKAPLQPILVLGEPFERVLLDCVGKSGHHYIVMCAATRYPKAILLGTLRAKAVSKSFFSKSYRVTKVPVQI